MVLLMSSQKFLDESIVKKKMEQSERWIHISPPFFHEGAVRSVLLDGHHSLAASLRLGELPLIDLIDDDAEVHLLYDDDIQSFFDWHKNDSEWYEIFKLSIDLEPVN